MTYSSRPESPRTVVNATRARQGRFGRHMIWVLIFGTLLAGLGLFATWTWKGEDLASVEQNNAKNPVLSQSFDAPPPANVTQSGADQAPPR